MLRISRYSRKVVEEKEKMEIPKGYALQEANAIIFSVHQTYLSKAVLHLSKFYSSTTVQEKDWFIRHFLIIHLPYWCI